METLLFYSILNRFGTVLLYSHFTLSPRPSLPFLICDQSGDPLPEFGARIRSPVPHWPGAALVGGAYTAYPLLPLSIDRPETAATGSDPVAGIRFCNPPVRFGYPPPPFWVPRLRSPPSSTGSNEVAVPSLSSEYSSRICVIFVRFFCVVGMCRDFLGILR